MSHVDELVSEKKQTFHFEELTEELTVSLSFNDEYLRIFVFLKTCITPV
jgi:hypothetical protein